MQFKVHWPSIGVEYLLLLLLQLMQFSLVPKLVGPLLGVLLIGFY